MGDTPYFKTRRTPPTLFKFHVQRRQRILHSISHGFFHYSTGHLGFIFRGLDPNTVMNSHHDTALHVSSSENPVQAHHGQSEDVRFSLLQYRGPCFTLFFRTNSLSNNRLRPEKLSIKRFVGSFWFFRFSII